MQSVQLLLPIAAFQKKQYLCSKIQLQQKCILTNKIMRMKTINSFRSKLFALALALIASLSIFASDDHSRFLCYTILTDSTIAITGQSEHITPPRYEYLPEDLVIPSTVTIQGKKYQVVAIDKWAFYWCHMLKSVVIPPTVTSIGENAFYSCGNLVDVHMPSTVKIVEGHAFHNTKWFDNLPDGDVYFNNTFYRYKGTIPENTKVVVKDGTTLIASCAFSNQPNIVSVELPQTLTVIEYDAFEGCTQLSSILIPKNVTDIGASAFADCTGLTEVICLAPTPPTMRQYANPSANSEIFARVDVSNATLFVRAESVEAYKNAEQWKEFGQILPLQPTAIEDLFPTLWGLQRTVCNEYCGDTEGDNSANVTYKHTFDRIRATSENSTLYIRCNDYLLREEDNKILLYSQNLNKDIVLYDFTLEVGDSLPAYSKDGQDGKIYPADTFVVTDISYVTLLDGKQYKKWTFDNGMEYVEGIGMYGGHRNGNFFGLIQEVVVPCHMGEHLVCVSKNGKLLYQMDDAEMERLGAECLCDYDRGPRKDNAKDGQIGGRPTPTQWNQLELDLRKMENGNTILYAETFNYTLENDSIVANGKTFYQLARQSTKDTATTKSFVGALHFGKDEDNRVYFLRDGVEYVLYDFTAEPGDTVEIFAGINNYPQETTYTHVVTGKDTLENGACRMFLEVVFPEETTTATNAEKVWLAGLGSIDGIVHNTATRTSNAQAAPSRSAHSSDTQTSVMLCAWRDDNCLYTTDHPDYDTLGCVYNIDEMTAIEDIHTSSSYQKLLRDGQLFIIHEGKMYNVMGIAVE